MVYFEWQQSRTSEVSLYIVITSFYSVIVVHLVYGCVETPALFGRSYVSIRISYKAQ